MKNAKRIHSPGPTDGSIDQFNMAGLGQYLRLCVWRDECFLNLRLHEVLDQGTPNAPPPATAAPAAGPPFPSPSGPIVDSAASSVRSSRLYM